MIEEKKIVDRLKKLPAMGSVIAWSELSNSIQSDGRDVVLTAVKSVLQDLRDRIFRGENPRIEAPLLVRLIMERLGCMSANKLQKVINATGILVHTNLGRAPLSESAAAAVYDIARNYSTLEYDIARGKRGSRHDLISELLTQVTSAKAGIAVNNNAAAVLLTLNTLAEGREVIVSRGELVEIGGSFRIPDVIRKSSCRMVEVGTTNKTHVADYRNAITNDTAVLLKVHRSNFRIEGFVSEVSIEQLVELGRQKNIPVMFDLGSGSLIADEAPWLIDEPTVPQMVDAHCNVLTFSGDKLLGGPQAGIIVGDKAIVDECKKNPLARAFRLDKMTLAALEATLSLYRDPMIAIREIPVLRAASTPVEIIESRATEMTDRLKDILKGAAEVETVATRARIGGGAMPLHDVPSFAVTIRPAKMSSGGLEKALRLGAPPIITRLSENRVWIDFRSLLDGQERIIENTLRNVLLREFDK